MGMFDYITCDYPLPIPEMQGRQFQTKAFDCQLSVHRITAEGKLLLEQFEYQRRDDPDSFFGFVLDRINQEWVEVDYHGDVYFYDWKKDNDHHSGLVTFRARFTEGRLTGIIVLGEDGV